jgi:peptidoglycan/LPS O-acetylase OafA/YrhL
MIDLMKVVAAQVILWHHFCRYGPMANTLHEHGQVWVGWLAQHGRFAVQVFLVVSGFLVMLRLKGWLADGAQGQVLIRASVRRSWRIAVPYWWMLFAALAAAWLARKILVNPDTPAAASPAQVLAHALFLQDILGQPALSTGVWYVAIDMQLHLGLTALALVMCWLIRDTVTRWKSIVWHLIGAALYLGLVCGMFVFGRDVRFETWAPFFLGPFCLGALIAWSAGINARLRRLSWMLLLLICVGALLMQWSVDIAVALGVAFALTRSAGPFNRVNGMAVNAGPFRASNPAIISARLSHQSYCLFLFHYPVILVVGSAIEAMFPGDATAAGLGMALAWCVAMVMAAWISGRLETMIRG